MPCASTRVGGEAGRKEGRKEAGMGGGRLIRLPGGGAGRGGNRRRCLVLAGDPIDGITRKGIRRHEKEQEKQEEQEQEETYSPPIYVSIQHCISTYQFTHLSTCLPINVPPHYLRLPSPKARRATVLADGEGQLDMGPVIDLDIRDTCSFYQASHSAFKFSAGFYVLEKEVYTSEDKFMIGIKLITFLFPTQMSS
ncbi:hypothetical protein E2C01_039866 [Portunus trituberculatus]|uniref:Uncharacterized protein n=1 Tax=Portunus trituberculatus TaxID=210409 RepID=A0A5B7FLB8_PORTR|nr:hypothetical protein [Portunus trituberculatus]